MMERKNVFEWLKFIKKKSKKLCAKIGNKSK